MEEMTSREWTLWRSFSPAIMLVLLSMLMILVAYGPETVAPVLHDVFHDFRHAIGMPCH